MLNKIYLVVLFLIPRHVIINITTSAFNCKNTIPDGGNHVELLNHRIHVTSSTSIFQPHKSFWWARSNRWQIFPLSKCFTCCKDKRFLQYEYDHFVHKLTLATIPPLLQSPEAVFQVCISASTNLRHTATCFMTDLNLAIC